MSQLTKNLKTIYTLNKFMNNDRKHSLINCFTYKTDKIQLMFENISNPLNVHACVRTGMNFGINTIHYIQKYDDLFSNFLNEKNKVNSGTIKWMDIKIHGTMTDFLNHINSKYDPVFISTDISNDSKNVLELNSILQGVINPYKEENKILSREILENLFQINMTKEKIDKLIKEYQNDESLKFDLFNNNQKFIENLYFNGKFVEKMKRKDSEKKKIVIFIFGNECRGISPFVKKLSHHKIIIPHFGYNETSYNLSVCCSMILFHLYAINYLPGSFMDFCAEDAIDILKRKFVNSFHNLSRSKIKHLGIDEFVDDL